MSGTPEADQSLSRCPRRPDPIPRHKSGKAGRHLCWGSAH